MATLRFVLAVVLLAFGCALLIASFQPEQGPAAVWVGGGVHGDHFSAREPLNTTQQYGARS